MDIPKKLEILFTDPLGRVILAIPAITFPVLNYTQLELLILLGAIIFDFITGCIASYVEAKEKGIKSESGFIFESKKARQTGIKSLFYIGLIIGSWAIQSIFFDKKFSFDSISTRNFGVIDLTIGFCVGIELYSIFIENSKKAGFDVVQKVKTIIKKVKEIIGLVKS